jgi:flagellar assembly protein FliH
MLRPHRFPPLSQLALSRSREPDGAVRLQASLADGFKEGLDRGYQEGLESGRRDGQAIGHRDGYEQGKAQARQEALARLAEIGAPVDAALRSLQALQADYQVALRREVVDLVAKVARQVIRCELALQPTQMLSLVDETLAVMPPASGEIEVYLNREDLERIRELDPQRAAQWHLQADARLEPGECRVKAGSREADAGCRQRLAACMEQVREHLLGDDEAQRIEGAAA